MLTFENVNSEIQKLRYALKADGGDIELVSVKDSGKVEVKLTGACGSCPMALMTIKHFVEAKLKEALPEVKEVVQSA